MSNPSSHPAFTVTDIKNFVNITLESEDVQYETWAELFLNTAAVFEVADHLVDPPEAKAGDTQEISAAEKTHWLHLDAIVKQWLYGTISKELLRTVVAKGATAKQIWNRLHDLFQDNKISREEFSEQTSVIEPSEPLLSFSDDAHSKQTPEESCQDKIPSAIIDEALVTSHTGTTPLAADQVPTDIAAAMQTLSLQPGWPEVGRSLVGGPEFGRTTSGVVKLRVV